MEVVAANAVSDGAAINQSMAASSQDIRGQVDINNDGTNDGWGTVHDGVLHMDDGRTFASWTVRTGVTGDEIFGDNGIQDTAWDSAAVAFENGQFFTGIGKIVSGAPEILGNFLDTAVRWLWEEIANEVTDVYGRFWEVHRDGNGTHEPDHPSTGLVAQPPADHYLTM